VSNLGERKHRRRGEKNAGMRKGNKNEQRGQGKVGEKLEEKRFECFFLSGSNSRRRGRKEREESTESRF